MTAAEAARLLALKRFRERRAAAALAAAAADAKTAEAERERAASAVRSFATRRRERCAALALRPEDGARPAGQVVAAAVEAAVFAGWAETLAEGERAAAGRAAARERTRRAAAGDHAAAERHSSAWERLGEDFRAEAVRAAELADEKKLEEAAALVGPRGPWKG